MVFFSGLDYSKWDNWVKNPDDPETKMEKTLKEEAINKARDAEFEKNNSEFCGQFKDDMEKRRDDTAAKERKSNGTF